jgi:hypothetical protein
MVQPWTLHTQLAPGAQSASLTQVLPPLQLLPSHGKKQWVQLAVLSKAQIPPPWAWHTALSLHGSPQGLALPPPLPPSGTRQPPWQSWPLKISPSAQPQLHGSGGSPHDCGGVHPPQVSGPVALEFVEPDAVLPDAVLLSPLALLEALLLEPPAPGSTTVLPPQLAANARPAVARTRISDRASMVEA